MRFPTSPPPNRRRILGGLTTASLAALTGTPLSAAPPWNRKTSRISGLSLAAYSLRSEFRWMKGKPGTGDLDMFGFLDYCARLGIDAAELTAYFFPEPIDTAYGNRIKRHAQLLGLDLSGGAIGNNFSHAPGSETALAQLDYTRTWIDRYADMGIPAIRVFAGNPAKGLGEDEAIANIIANLTVALEHAEKRGVLLGMENHDFTRNVDRFLRVVGAIESDWLGATLDTANVESHLDPYAQLERIAPHAVTAQVKVMLKGPDGAQPTDFARVLDILAANHYRGYVVLEYEEKDSPYEEIPKHLATLRTLIEARNRVS